MKIYRTEKLLNACPLVPIKLLDGETGSQNLALKVMRKIYHRVQIMATMQAELEEHLASGDKLNRKNGTTSKTMKSPAGSFELQTPLDRASTFESQIVKHQAQLTDELERKITALFALGNSYQNIRTHIADICGMELSNGTNNTVTNKLCLGLKPGVSVIWRLFTLSSSSTLFIL